MVECKKAQPKEVMSPQATTRTIIPLSIPAYGRTAYSVGLPAFYYHGLAGYSYVPTGATFMPVAATGPASAADRCLAAAATPITPAAAASSPAIAAATAQYYAAAAAAGPASIHAASAADYCIPGSVVVSGSSLQPVGGSSVGLVAMPRADLASLMSGATAAGAADVSICNGGTVSPRDHQQQHQQPQYLTVHHQPRATSVANHCAIATGQGAAGPTAIISHHSSAAAAAAAGATILSITDYGLGPAQAGATDFVLSPAIGPTAYFSTPSYLTARTSPTVATGFTVAPCQTPNAAAAATAIMDIYGATSGLGATTGFMQQIANQQPMAFTGTLIPAAFQNGYH